MSIIILPDSDF